MRGGADSQESQGSLVIGCPGGDSQDYIASEMTESQDAVRIYEGLWVFIPS
jgi:hypothetical protein